MCKGQASKRAVQLAPDKLGVSEWQRDFWLALIKHAQAGNPGPPDLSRLVGFGNPALVRHAVTTPDFQHGFDKYNAGKPYCRQVRPFGFMVMFQQEELEGATVGTPAARTPHKRGSTVLRIIAPFNRDPVSAARHAFNRDTGTVIPAKQLKTYARALRHYHDHPEAKFLNGERAERGPTMRRHVIVRSVRHIGKEANRLDDQLILGIDPSAQAEFSDGSCGMKTRLVPIKAAVETYGVVRVAREAGVSRQHLHRIMNGANVSDTILHRIGRAVMTISTLHEANTATTTATLGTIRALVKRTGLRKAAAALKIDAGRLSRILSGDRPLSALLSHCV